MAEQVPPVVIGMDPHKRSVTIELMSADESVLGGGRFDTTVDGYAALLEYVAACLSGSGPSRALTARGGRSRSGSSPTGRT